MPIRTSPFARDLDSARRVTRGWLAYLLIFLGCVFIVQFGALAWLASTWPAEPGSPAAQAQEAIASLLSILALAAWVLLYERRSLATLGLRRPARGVLSLLAGVIGGLALVSLPIVFLWVTGSYTLVDAPASDATSGWSALPLVTALALTVVVQAGNEEFLVRGYLLQNQARKVPGWLAVVLPSLVFTLLHGVLDTPIAFITLMAFALFASFVVLTGNSLWAIIGIHAGWNIGLGNVYGIPVSGLPPHTASLIYLQPATGSPDWLTGGTFGTEAGVPAALTLTIAALVAFLLLRRHARTWPATAAPDDTVDAQ